MLRKIFPLVVLLSCTYLIFSSAIIKEPQTNTSLEKTSNSSITVQDKIVVVESSDGFRLEINGTPFFIKGMNWDYFPIGTNYNYSLWKQSDEVVKAALNSEMTMLKNIGVNTIRMYTGIPAKWIEYIYKNHGIRTMLNHSFGRYGISINGKEIPHTDYSNDLVKEKLVKETREMVLQYQNTPGLLLFLLGNENNYGLFWRGAETEDIPVEDKQSTKDAESLYKLFNEAALAMKEESASHPIAICNGDLMFLDIISKHCKDIDILGVNTYRGLTFTDLYKKADKTLGKPIVLTEFGTDAFNIRTQMEDQQYQAKVLVSNWKDIYNNAAGIGKCGNSLGGFTFQFSDGWWKTGQTVNLSKHDSSASWSNGGYANDFQKGVNNMNEEWFGICAKGPTNDKGLYTLYPRAAYYALKEVHQFNPYSAGTKNTKELNAISISDAVLKANNSAENLQINPKSIPASPAPIHSQSDVLSVFSDEYKPATRFNYAPRFGGSATATQIVRTSSGQILKYENNNFTGIMFNETPLDASDFTFLHIDVLVKDPNASIGIEIRDIGKNKQIETDLNSGLPIGDDKDFRQTVSGFSAGAWKSFDIPLAGNIANQKENIGALILVGGSNFSIDNVYFYK